MAPILRKRKAPPKAVAKPKKKRNSIGKKKQEIGPNDFISALPDDCIFEFAKYLTREEILELSCANRRMSKFVREDSLKEDAGECVLEIKQGIYGYWVGPGVRVRSCCFEIRLIEDKKDLPYYKYEIDVNGKESRCKHSKGGGGPLGLWHRPAEPEHPASVPPALLNVNFPVKFTVYNLNLEKVQIDSNLIRFLIQNVDPSKATYFKHDSPIRKNLRKAEYEQLLTWVNGMTRIKKNRKKEEEYTEFEPLLGTNGDNSFKRELFEVMGKKYEEEEEEENEGEDEESGDNEEED